MKRILALLCCLVLLTGLTACGSDELSEERMITRPPEEAAVPMMVEAAPEPTETETTEAAAEAAPVNLGNYTFEFDGVELIPGVPFDPSVLPAAESVYEVPSCAIEGTDILYNYNVVEVTVFDAGQEPVIYSIYLLDANTSTDEGLYLGDDVATVESIYGTDYKEDGTAMVYEKRNTQLRILIDNGAVFNIEYRMITA